MRYFINTIWNYLRGSYSQEGEDISLAHILNTNKSGFYIDIGAHHPHRFSNTYYFYKMGWQGINIDATPGSMKLFKKFRSRDINLEVPISNSTRQLDYYLFTEPALNGFSGKLSKWRDAETKYKIEKIIKLKPHKLSEILDKYLPASTKIDFMSIDVEGYEYQVLVSNNWSKYKPVYLLVEILNTDIKELTNNKIVIFLKKRNYNLINTVGRTSIFKLN